MNNILTSKGSIANNQRGGRTGQDQQCNVVTLFFGFSISILVLRRGGLNRAQCLGHVYKEEGVRCGRS